MYIYVAQAYTVMCDGTLFTLVISHFAATIVRMLHCTLFGKSWDAICKHDRKTKKDKNL